jgi:hypothetical protein
VSCAARPAAAWAAGALAVALGAASAELSAGPPPVDRRTAGRGAGQTRAKPPAASVQPAAAYYPDRFEWQRRAPQDTGVDAARKDRQIVSPEWIALARTPGAANPTYGFMNWYLNTDGKPLPAAPPSSVMFAGSGANIVYIDWDHDLVAVVRWIRGGPALNELIGKLLTAIR